ncbi:MAG: hypothetical protein ABSA58_01395 [Acetobacteraceae bacterium]
MTESDRFTAMMEKSAALKQRIGRELGGAVVGVVEACERSLAMGGKMMFCGNGGSAADSQHLATEMLVRLRPNNNRRPIAALALTLDPAMLTALGGDGKPAIDACDHVLLVPDTETARIQECHIALGHAVLELLEDRLIASGRA